MLKAIFSILLPCISFSLWAGDVHSEQRWIDRKSEGWFWYKKEPEPEIVEPSDNASPPTTSSTDRLEKPSKPETDMVKGPAPLSAAWIRENIKSYLDAATDDPSEENIAAYLYIQRYAMDKSFAFMDATQDVVTGNPDLDEINRRPTATYANRQLDQMATSNNKALLNEISQSAGLFVFLDNSEASLAQLRIVDMLENSTPFSSVKISASESRDALPGTRPDRGHSQQIGIKSYPAIALMRSDGVFDVISQGPVSLPDLSRRILIGAKRLNLITDSEFNSTRPINIVESAFPSLDSSVETSKEGGVPIPASEIVKAFSGDGI